MEQKNKGGGKVLWNEQFKIRIRRNASVKHEHTKLSIVKNLIEKYKNILYWIRIYTEYSLSQDNKVKIADVYFENIKNNEIICYEIQKNISKDWLKSTKDFYYNFERIYFKTDWILIKEKDLSNNIEKLDEQIKDLII